MSDRVLEIQSVQVSPIRNMITALKDVLTDATITFTKNGLKIINFDKTHTILVNVTLDSNKFEKYRCDPDKIIVCANTLHLFKVISTMSNDVSSLCSAISKTTFSLSFNDALYSSIRGFIYLIISYYY